MGSDKLRPEPSIPRGVGRTPGCEVGKPARAAAGGPEQDGMSVAKRGRTCQKKSPAAGQAPASTDRKSVV